MFLKSFIGGVVIATGLTLTATSLTITSAVAEQTPPKKPDVAEMLKRKMLQRPRTFRPRSYARQVYGSATVSREVKADLVVLNVGLKAKSDNAGNAVKALDAKKSSIIESIKASGFDVSNTDVSNLRVYGRTRSQYVNGVRQMVKSFDGSMSIEFTFKASDDVLADVAKIAGDRVSSINSMRFKFSKQAWDAAVTELKASALEKATQDAKTKAARQNRTLDVLTAKTVNDPYSRGLRGLSKRSVLLQVRARVTYQTK